MKRIILVFTAALLLVAMTVAVAPAMAQEEKKEESKTQETKTQEKGKEEKDKMKDEEKKDLPKSGGVPISASLIGLGTGVLLVGGGLFAIRVTRQR
jgi:uncharacterized membrane protein YfcA